MSAVQLRRLTRLGEQFPVDKSKAGRDFGEYVRKYAMDFGKKGEASVAGKFDDTYDSISKLRDNYFKDMYPYNRTTGCSGLNIEELRYVVSNQGLNDVQEYSKGMVRRNFERIKSVFSRRKE